MSPDDRRHGTNAGAIQHWRDGERPCEPCDVARRRASKIARADRLRGNPRLTTLGAAAHQVIAATPRDQLSRATGITVAKLCKYLAAGPDGRVNRRTRARILAAGAKDFWTPVGIQRRLRALEAIGWSMRSLAQELDMWESMLRRLLAREQPRFVRRDVAERILDGYERLSMTLREGRGATRARNTATRNGWAPPLAWDNIDDPNEQPSDWSYRPPTREETLKEVYAGGGDINDAAERLGISREAVGIWCRKYGHTELYNTLWDRRYAHDPSARRRAS